MPITAAQIGVPLNMEEDVPYALPVKQCLGFVADPNSNLEVAMTWDTADVDWIPIANSEGNFFTSAPFIRTPDAAGATIIMKSVN